MTALLKIGRRLLSIFAVSTIGASALHGADLDLWTHYTNQNIVSSIAQGEDEIFFGTTGGIRRYHRFRDTWLRPITTVDGLPDNWVESLAYEPQSGDLNIRTRTGTARWMSRLEALTLGGFNQPKHNPYLPRIPNVTPPFGYYINGNIIRGPTKNYRITDALVDSWNILWIATEGLGVGRADLTFNELKFLRSGPIVDNVTAVALDGDDVWVGGQDGYNVFARGISRFQRDQETWTYYEQDAITRLDDTQVHDILPDSTDAWFATDRGVVRFRKRIDTWDMYRFSTLPGTRHLRSASSLAKADSRLWIGTERGLAVLDLETDTIRAVGGSHQFRIRDLETGNRFVWAATNKGLFRADRKDASWTEASTDPITRQPILALAASGDTTWAFAAHPPTLLISTNPDSSWISHSIPEAAGQTTVRLTASGERAWIGTDAGAVRVNTKNGKTTILSQIDGLLDDRIQAIQLEGPTVWIGGPKGLSLYNWRDDFNDPED